MDRDFGASGPNAPAPLPSPPALAQRSSSLERFFSSPLAERARLPWVPLPGTRKEAESIQLLFPNAQLFLGPEASKQKLLQLPTPAVLHLATHGFFLEDSSTPSSSRAVGVFNGPSGPPPAQKLPDPLLRAGLVLSGAGSQAPEAAENSLATALELTGLNLWGTQLVVLSACETGRGDVKLGQGVYGLRRAFFAAGAETLVSSLWKVNDETTHQLMQAYYRNLVAGMPRISALREAMQQLRKTQPHPYAWAPFIALGLDAPLRLPAPPAQQQPDL